MRLGKQEERSAERAIAVTETDAPTPKKRKPKERRERTSILVRLSPEVLAAMMQISRANQRSRIGEIEVALRQYIAREREKGTI